MKEKIPSAGDIIADFRVLEVRPCPGLGGYALLAEHTRLATKFLHILNTDEENLCAIVVPTPPSDDTGLPHIMEHSVLGGSQDYPLKDPFFEMVKTSLATFINAMTSSDFTIYPFSSVVKKDLFNLARVYTDAVFRPLFSENTFRREAWHYRISADNRLEANGIVYNEMKSAYSSPETHVWRHLSCGLLPDSLLRYDAGGFPPAIPALTYTDFRAFHGKWYAPRNARIFAYGNLATAEIAAFFSEKLQNFPAGPAEPFAYPPQPRWTAPREAQGTYPVNPGDPLSERTYLSLTWILSEVKDPFELASWMVLYQILFGHDAAPMKKALVESGLGTEPSMNFLFPLGSELVMGFGLKGSEPGRAEKFRDIVLGVMEKTSREGFSAEQIRTAVRQLSYQHLERNQNFILNLLMNLVPVWMHADDPFTFLNMAELLDSVRANAIGSPDLFRKMLRNGLLDNPHRLLLSTTPDPELAARTEKEMTASFAKKAEELGPEGLKKTAAEAEELDRLNAENDTPEKLRLLPRLALSDLPDTPWKIPAEMEKPDDRTELLLCRMQTNGIFYGALDADLSGLPQEFHPYLPVFTELFQKMGTTEWSWSETAERKAAAGRGFSCSPSFFGSVSRPGFTRPGLRCSFVSLGETVNEAAEIFAALLGRLDPSDFERLTTVSCQYASSWHDRILQDGIGTARAHARRPYSPATAAEYLMNGVPGYRLAREFKASFEREKDVVVRAFHAIRGYLLSARWTASCAGPDYAVGIFRSFLKGFSADHPPRFAPQESGLPAPSGRPVFEGITVPLRTTHTMIVCPAPHASDPGEPLIQLGAEVISNDYWLPRIRFRGGAYGARIGHDRHNALWGLLSYADPDFRKTWQAFREMPAGLAEMDLSRERLDQLVISALRPDINPLKPEQAVHSLISRRLLEESPDYRARRYAAIRAASPEAVKKAVAEHLEKNADKASFCAVGGPEQISSASACAPADAFVRLDPLSS